ncbi:MAG: thioredoxin family protein [Gudongella sp.]|jgi:glutaredoxin-like protein|nr:thioredoxin family protein [Gudongella sp.]
MKYLNEDVLKQLQDIFSAMNNEVNIALFTKEEPCETCEETKDFVGEIMDASPKLKLHNFDLNKDSELAKQYEVTMTPSLVILDKDNNYKRIKFNGIPSGHEINSFISSILAVSGSGQKLPEDIVKKVAEVSKPVNIKVFVTLACPHCPGAVEKAHLLALENDNIVADMIEAQTFYDLSEKYNVSSVPKIVVNDKYEFVGNQPFEVFLDEIMKTQM